MSQALASRPQQDGMPRSRPKRGVATGPIQVSAEATAWAARYYRVRGWKSQNASNKVLKDELDSISAALFPAQGEGSAAGLTAEQLDPGKEFKTYLKELAAYEQNPNPKQAAILKTAAEIYIAHYDTHSKSVKSQKKTRRKYDVCSKTLTDLELRSKIEGVGPPPWDSTAAMAAATVKAEADFSTLPLGQQTAESQDGKGVNPTFWVNKAGSSPDKPVKSFLFKPATSKQDRQGIPPGGEPAREALTGRAADVLNGMTGIDFKVPSTHIVSVGRERFEGITLGAEVVDSDGTGPLTGSLQQFAPSKGEMRDNPPSLARAVPAERCQELAILDIVTLHVDRHSGNFMIDGEENGAAELVPIDNGLSFPETPDALGYMSTRHNSLLRLPGAHQPFTPEMLKKIAKIDPNALKSAMQSEVADIEQVHPSAQRKVGDAALEQSRRSAMFLKLAAPTLSPAAVQVALGQNATTLFETGIDDNEFTRRANAAIAAISGAQADVAEFCQMSQDEYLRAEAACKGLGWDLRDLSPQQCMAVIKSGVQRPPAPVVPANNAPATQQELADIRTVFPNGGKPSLSIAAWRELATIGTVDQIKAAVAAATSRMSDVTFKQATIDSPKAALRVIRSQAAADAIPPVTAVAATARLIAAKRDLVKQLALCLPDAMQAQISKRADTLHDLGQKDALDRFRDQVTGAVRKVLLQECEACKAKAKTITDAKTLTLVLNEIASAERLIRKEADFLGAKQTLVKVRNQHLNF